MLITYLSFQSTERFFSGVGEGGREGVQMPAINECHLLHRGRAEPMVAKAVRVENYSYLHAREQRGEAC